MRITDKNYKIRPTNIRQVEKKVYFAFEATKTEPKYFYGLLNRFLPKDIYPINFYKESNCGKSNPLNIVKELVQVLDEKQKLQLTFEAIADILSRFSRDNDFATTKGKVRSIVEKTATCFGKKINDHVEQEEVSAVVNKYIDHIRGSSILNIAIIESDEIMEILSEYCEYRENDEIILVCDRDAHSFVSSQFDAVMEVCQKHNILLCLTNPCIEFWFLLHHTDCKEFKQEDILQNKKVSKNSFIYSELKKKDPSYTKNNFNVDLYLSKLPEALKNATYYEDDITKLKSKVGSNLPLVIKKYILKKDDL